MKKSIHPEEKPQTSPAKKRNWLMIASLTLNAVLVTLIAGFYGLSWYLDRSNVLLMAEANAYHLYFCEEKYDDMMKIIEQNGDESDPERVYGHKNVYALTMCLRNYKTGENLDLQPLIDEVNETPPETDYES